MPVVRKAVLPVAGLGTRALPASKAIPKELLPVVDKPAVQYMVEECVRAGLDDVLFVSSAGKSAIEDHFDRLMALEGELEARGKTAELDVVRRLGSMATITSVRQPQPLGLGHAVLMAAPHVGDESFAVLLGDDIVDPGAPFLERMITTHLETGRPVLALMEVPDAQVSMYGIARVVDEDDDGVMRVTELVEKPQPDEAPSNLAIIGRYVLPSAVFDALRRTGPGRGGEIQLTDALQMLATDEPVVALRLDAPRHDVGDKLGFLQATVALAAAREDLGPPFLDWLRGWIAEHDA
jgi:UTP--glucose-1-phosphate uridylyltransferase